MSYSLSFSKEQIDKIKKLIYKTGEVIPEIEFRLGYKTDRGFSSNNGEGYFELFVDRVRASNKYNSVISTSDIVYNKGELRKIVGSTTTYQEKIKSNYDITIVSDFVKYDNATIRFSHAFEVLKTKEDYDNSKSSILERQRERTTFVFPKFNIDCTKVTQVNKKFTEYEIEAELHSDFVEEILTKGVKDSFKDLVTVLKQIFGIFFDNIHNIYSVEVYAPIKILINNLYRNIEKAVRPKNIYIEEAETGLLNYAITNKLDGIGYQFFIHEEETDKKYHSFFLKNKVEVWKLGQVPFNNKLIHYAENIFDAEFFKDGIYIFDVIVPNNPLNNMKSDGLFKRLEFAQTMIDTISPIIQNDPFLKRFTFNVKKFYNSDVFDYNLKLLFEDLTKTFETEIVQNNDGIIFQNIGQYNPKDPIYKWKFYSKITVDFLFEYKSNDNNTTTYNCKVVGPGGKFLNFRLPDSSNTLEFIADNNKLYNGIKGSNLNGYIVEVGRDTNNELLIHRIRFDKNPEDANFVTIATATWKDIINELTLASVARAIDNSRARLIKKEIEEEKLEDFEEPYEIIFEDRFSSSEYFPSVIPNPFRFSNVSVFSTANQDQAEKTLQVIELFFPRYTMFTDMSIIDLSACIGGNTWIFYDKFGKVYANELSPLHFKLLKNNMLSIPSKSSVKLNNFFNDNAFDIIHTMNFDIVFADPPWGGVDYKKDPKVGYYKNGVFFDIMELILNNEQVANKMVVLRVPQNYVHNEVISEKFKHYYRIAFNDVKGKGVVYDIIVLSTTPMVQPLPTFNVFRVPFKQLKYRKITPKEEQKLDAEYIAIEEYILRKHKEETGEVLPSEPEYNIRLTKFPKGPTGQKISNLEKTLMSEEEATLLKNFIYYDCLSYGDRQVSNFNLNKDSSMFILDKSLGITTTVLYETFKNIDSAVPYGALLEPTKYNLSLYNVNVDVSSVINLPADSYDVIVLDMRDPRYSEEQLEKRMFRQCKLLVVYVSVEWFHSHLQKILKDKEYLISENLEGYKIVGIFTTTRDERKVEVEITRNCLEIFRKEYNNYKKQLIKEYCERKTVLDIGFGMGGDINKYIHAKTKTLFGVEPSNRFLESFKTERINDKNKEWIEKRVKILNARGQDTNEILEFIDGKVDVVTMMFSLSFFYRYEEDLTALADTIGKSLKDNGVFIGGFMNGRMLEDILSFTNGIYKPCYEIKPINVTTGKIYGQEIVFNMRESKTATTQTEYLIYLEELQKKLAEYDIYIEKYIESEEVIDYSLLTKDEKYLASLYSFFVFKKRYYNIVYNPTVTPLILDGNNLIRLPTEPDGNCYFYSVLRALNKDLASRENMLSLREHLAANYTIEEYEKHWMSVINLQMRIADVLGGNNKCSNELYKDWSQDKIVKFINYIIGTFNPDSFKGYLETLENEFVKLGLDRELSREMLRGCHYYNYMTNVKILETDKKWPIEELYPYVADQLNVNIYFITNRTRKLVSFGNKDIVKDNGKINLIFINNDNMHFEVLAKYLNNRYVTTFTVDEVKSFL
jgi:hypothetical protein